MSDYIKREDAIELINSLPWTSDADQTKRKNLILLFTLCDSADVVEADKAQKEIDYWHDKAQSYEQTILKLALNKADVVEVVRCKDCKWWKPFNHVMGNCGHDMRHKDQYCDRGKREEA